MNFKEIKKVKWKYLINRKETLLFHSNADSSYRYFKQLTGIPWQPDYILRDSNGDYFTTDKTINSFSRFFSASNAAIFNHFRGKLIYYVKKFDDSSSKMEKIDFSETSNKKLAEFLNKYLEHASYAENFLLPMPLADKIISQMIIELLPGNSEKEKQRLLRILTYPIKENEHTKEERSFYKLALAYKGKNKSLNQLLQKHLRKFSWIGARYQWKYAWVKRNLIERLENFFNKHKNPNKEIKHLGAIRDKVQGDLKKIINQLKIKKNSLIYNLIFLAKDFAYLKTWRTDVIYRSFFRARKIFYEIAKRAELHEDDIIYLTSNEALELAKSGKVPISDTEFRKRKQYYVKVIKKNKIFIFSGKEWIKKLEFLKHGLVKQGKISGKSAFKGKVSGRVKIVKTERDINKLENGDILVAVMTFPHFVPAMEKAAAFVTDEGGILCHAAIVSREFKKPCIIGTKIATQVLKDGDLVEVDAEKGIVKIIKKATA